MLDDETRRIVIQKTWCHGQVLAPFYGLLCWIWFFRTTDEHNPGRIMLTYAGIVLPIWCYVSYRNVFISFSSQTLRIGGVIVEIAYISVLILSIRQIQNSTSTDPSRTYFMLMAIASGLFAIETFAFIVVATALHRLHNEPRYDDMSSHASATTNVPGVQVTIHQIPSSYRDTTSYV